MRQLTLRSLAGVAMVTVVMTACEGNIVSSDDDVLDESLGKYEPILPVCHAAFDPETQLYRIVLLNLPSEAASRHYGKHCYGSTCDYNPLSLGASGTEHKDLDNDGVADGCEIPASDPSRGRLANPGFEGHSIKSVYFFAGNWRNGVQFYEYDPDDNTGLYTEHPTDARHLGWSESEANRTFAVDEMIAAGANVVNMSVWGIRGTDNWAWWAPMQTSTFAHDELFDVAVGSSILIVPYIESYAATQISSEFFFVDDFPGTQSNPAPALLAQINDLVERYVLTPMNSAWPDQWAQIYDRNGQKRFAIAIIHVATNQPGVTNASFAQGFGWVADKVLEDTGVRVGFMLDMLPWHTGAPGAFKPNPSAIGPLLELQPSVLAVQCFIPEIWTASSDESFLASWKRDFSASWIETGIPFIQDVSPGYDARVVFPGSPIYGNNASWRDAQTALVADLDNLGVTVNTWNGYTEGFAVVPTLQYGTANLTWMSSVFGLEP